MEDEKRTIVQTSDGSHTIRNESTGDTYHSVHGAVQESQHVFLKSGLEFFLNTHPTKHIKILEVGFGTGLNALLTLQQHTDIQIQYTTLEPYPLSDEIFRQLNYNEKGKLMALHACDWNSPQKISNNFTLTKLQTTLEQAQLPENFFDVVYFDAFAPNSQPELWTPKAFEKIYQAMTQPAVLATYCAKGQVKRDLKSVGFTIESIPGPPGKREMVRAIKQA
jgi:tRNA U34 5-methylaminomethyl-2-thiouridine-forming methyltransferase MnmC